MITVINLQLGATGSGVSRSIAPDSGIQQSIVIQAVHRVVARRTRRSLRLTIC